MPVETDFAVLTAKVEEYGAFLEHLEGQLKWPGSRDTPNQYGWTVGTIATPTGRLTLALGLTHEQTNVPSALAALATFARFKPRYIVFLGIAASLHEDVRKGDVLIADYVRAYQYGRILESGAFKPRPQFQEPTSQTLRTNAAVFAHTTRWWTGLGPRPDGGTDQPAVHFGGLASGDAVVENAVSECFAPVLENDPWLRAVEMESAGLALAVRNLREQGFAIDLMVVRGISDVPRGIEELGSSSTTDGTNRRTRKQWTAYAARAASHFLAQYIGRGFPYTPDAARKARRQLDPAVFDCCRSHFVDSDSLATIHAVNDEAYEPSDLVPKKTLELWWRANPLAMRVVSTKQGEAVGYWQILPLTPTSFQDLVAGRLTESRIGVSEIVNYLEFRTGSVFLYITALAVLPSMRTRSAAVILDLMSFLMMIHSTIGIDGIAAQDVSGDALRLMAEHDMVRIDSRESNGASIISTWVVEPRTKVDKAMKRVKSRLTRLKGWIPEMSRNERHAVLRLLSTNRIS